MMDATSLIGVLRDFSRERVGCSRFDAFIARDERRHRVARRRGHDYLTAHKAALDVAFSLEQNQYNGETYVELTLADVRKSEDVRM